MNFHRYLIHGYRYLTTPIRRGMLSRMRRRGTVPVGILFYHRVDDRHLNPWTITNDRFIEQIGWLEKNFDLVSMSEAQNRIRSGHNDRPTISISFDDGYSDNCTLALPMLIQKGIPFTYFVTSKHTLQEEPFPHDLELERPLGINNLEMLKSLHRAGVEIGAHTRTHADLGKIEDHSVLFDEVIGCKRLLEQRIGCQIRYFAFPYGQRKNLNKKVFQICKNHGIEGVCSAYGGWNDIGDDDFHLHRFHGDYRTAYLQNWLTFDPRKRKVDQFEYDLRESSDHVHSPDAHGKVFPGVSGSPAETSNLQTTGES